MDYTKTRIDEDTFIIFNGYNDGVIIKDYGDSLRVIYTDEDPGLIAAAEYVAFEMKKKSIIAGFCDAEEGVADLFRKRDFITEKSINIISASIDELFSSKAVERVMDISFEDVVWIPFRDLMVYQVEELLDVFESSDIPIFREDILRFDEDLSGVIFNRLNKIEAFILVSVKGGNLNIECVHGLNKNEPKFIMSVLKGFAGEMNLGFKNLYENIFVIEANKTIGALMTKLLDKKYKIENHGKVVRVKKHIIEEPEGISIEDNDSISRRMYDELVEKMEKKPYQDNLNWKIMWELEEKET